MKKEKLMSLVGKKVYVYFAGEESGIYGMLHYADEFSAKHDYRKPKYFYIGHTSFKASHVRKVEESPIQDRKREKMTREEAATKLLSIFISDCDLAEALIMGARALEQEPCEDAISREELLKAINTWDRFGVDDTNSLFRLDNLSLPHYVPYIHYDDVINCIKGMPSVKQESKTGHWKEVNYREYKALCSNCGTWSPIMGNYCPYCGAKMESEGV